MCGIVPAAHAPMILAASGKSVSLTGTVSMTTLASIRIPANTVQRGGALIRANSYWTTNATANNKTYRANISGLQNSSGNIANASSGGTNPATAPV